MWSPRSIRSFGRKPDALFALVYSRRMRDAITQTLLQCAAGDTAAWQVLAPIVYDELHRLAESCLRGERRGHTLQPTALVHESYLRLVSQRLPVFEARSHFYALAARIMRQVLVDSARAHKAAKRGGDMERVGMDGAGSLPLWPNPMLEIDDALRRLAEYSREQAESIELHYFGGLAVAEIANVTGRSTRTLARELKAGRLFLARALAGDH